MGVPTASFRQAAVARVRENSLLAALGLLAVTSAAQDLAITSAASYAPSVSPGSIAALFASHFAPDSSEATLDDQGRLPLELGGMTVTIDNRPAGLLFVSRLQINLVVPDQASTSGSEAIVTLANGELIRGRVEIKDVSPVLFSLDASGRGPGAIQNV